MMKIDLGFDIENMGLYCLKIYQSGCLILYIELIDCFK